jgi:hypothetical protein
MFLMTPVVITFLQIYALTHPGWLSKDLPATEFKYLYEFQRALAILVFGLAGLRTYEVVKEKNGPRRKPKPGQDEQDMG